MKGKFAVVVMVVIVMMLADLPDGFADGSKFNQFRKISTAERDRQLEREAALGRMRREERDRQFRKISTAERDRQRERDAALGRMHTERRDRQRERDAALGRMRREESKRQLRKITGIAKLLTQKINPNSPISDNQKKVDKFRARDFDRSPPSTRATSMFH